MSNQSAQTNTPKAEIKPTSVWGVFRHTGRSAFSSFQTIREPLHRIFLFISVIAIASETTRIQRNHDERILTLISRQKRSESALNDLSKYEDTQNENTLVNSIYRRSKSILLWPISLFRGSNNVSEGSLKSKLPELPSHLQSMIKLSKQEVDKLDEIRKPDWSWY